MTATREATTVWTGGLTDGSGETHLDSSDSGEFPVTWAARVAPKADITSPEELVAAAHASCFSMALSNQLVQAGHKPERIQTTAVVTLKMLDDGPTITTSHLLVGASVPGMSDSDFQEIAGMAKDGCPVSKALTGVTITMEASLG